MAIPVHVVEEVFLVVIVVEMPGNAIVKSTEILQGP